MRKLSILCLCLSAVLSLQAQEQLPQDPQVRKGTLKNGLTYYIRHNAKEPGLADFYIAQRVGSILEEPRQRGLAHFLEHMAFNGTKNFPGKGKRLGIVPWCETIGVKFGANLNAYTSVDQTVYHIGAAPLKREGILDSCLLVLHDWSHYILLEDAEIDKERGVIHEEWRNRRAGMAMQRLMENAMPAMYKGSKYEDCLPIGSMDVVDNFPYKDLRDYYQKWYRPDLQAVIVVGDVNVDQVERKIKKMFSPIPLPKNRAERVYYPVPDNDSLIVVIERDKEQPVVLAHLYMKRDATPDSEKNTVAYLRGDYVDDLIATMLNDRLSEIRQQPDPPIMNASGRGGIYYVSRTKEAFSMSISCKQDNILGGIISALGATERARQHGFTASELERAKKLYLASAERQWKQQGDLTNHSFVNRCVNNFLSSEPLISSDDRYELMKRFDREVTLEEVNSAARELITDKNQVLTLFGPDKPEVEYPSAAMLRQIVKAAQSQTYAPYVEAEMADHLMASLPTAGTIVSEKPYGNNGFTLLTLSNGMKVYFRQTDFQKDAVTMLMKGEGGTSLYPDEDIPNFSLISSAVTEGGVADFDQLTLKKMLTGKIARVKPSVGSKGQSISGSSSVKDVRTMMELAHLYFTQPRRDDEAFKGLVNRTRSFLTNRNASPRVDYNDSINAILFNHHPRVEPVRQATLDKVSYDRILEIYKERFSDAANFNTVIIGNISIDELRPLLCQYLASLPATHKQEKTDYSRVPRVVGGTSVHKFSKQQATPLANVSVYYTADVEFSPKSDLSLDFLRRVLQIAYTDSVREEKGGTYGVSVSFELNKDDVPNTTLAISYKADPQRYEELTPIIYQQLENIAKYGPVESSMQKIKEYLVKQYDQAAITNDYWSYIIWHEIDDDADFDKDYKKLVMETTPDDVKQMAQKILAAKRCIEVTMLSE